MQRSDKTARELYLDLKAAPSRRRFGFGRRAALVNIDLQCAYTQLDRFATAYETDPAQIAHVNRLAQLCRTKAFPVIWTYVAYEPDGSDCGVWGTRSDTPDSLQNIKENSERAAFDPRADIAHGRDAIMRKRMASAFFETNLASLLVWHKVDTIVVTGGSTSGCIRATCIDGLSRGYRMIVPEECVADKHESPHFANLYDIAVKYGDVLGVDDVAAGLDAMV